MQGGNVRGTIVPCPLCQGCPTGTSSKRRGGGGEAVERRWRAHRRRMSAPTGWQRGRPGVGQSGTFGTRHQHRELQGRRGGGYQQRCSALGTPAPGSATALRSAAVACLTAASPAFCTDAADHRYATAARRCSFRWRLVATSAARASLGVLAASAFDFGDSSAKHRRLSVPPRRSACTLWSGGHRSGGHREREPSGEA